MTESNGGSLSKKKKFYQDKTSTHRFKMYHNPPVTTNNFFLSHLWSLLPKYSGKTNISFQIPNNKLLFIEDEFCSRAESSSYLLSVMTRQEWIKWEQLLLLVKNLNISGCGSPIFDIFLSETLFISFVCTWCFRRIYIRTFVNLTFVWAPIFLKIQ